MDVILHKLTEDILCLSQLAMTRPELKQNLIERKIRSIQDTGLDLDNEDEQAVQRVLNVSNFHHMNPECHLVDDPARVLTLMSRADIADTLKYCLTNVVSASGIPVGSPAYAVISPSRDFTYDSTIVDSVVQQMDWSWLHTKVSTLSYPLIVKPLTAAGTKASHAMAVIMDPTALQKVVSEKSPCILQQYSNHDALLYKVYVLGNHVSVHKRRSVPNLPKNVSSILNYVDFDSQRPYPRLSDFGYPENVIQEDVDKDCTTQSNQKRPRPRPRPRQCENMCAGVIHDNKNIITVEEIMPIVNSLKDAFGLELFGFDVLITPVEECDNKCNNHTCDDKCRRMLVIDVNYFPSYKEVTNFPALLAKYLTDRALESRRKARRKST